MALNTPESREFEYWRQIIENLGGNLIGAQSPLSFDPDAEYKVVFTRNNSTQLLSLKVSEFSEEAVKEKLGWKPPSANTIFLKFSQSMVERLRKLSDEIEEESKWLKT